MFVLSPTHTIFPCFFAVEGAAYFCIFLRSWREHTRFVSYLLRRRASKTGSESRCSKGQLGQNSLGGRDRDKRTEFHSVLFLSVLLRTGEHPHIGGKRFHNIAVWRRNATAIVFWIPRPPTLRVLSVFVVQGQGFCVPGRTYCRVRAYSPTELRQSTRDTVAWEHKVAQVRVVQQQWEKFTLSPAGRGGCGMSRGARGGA